MFITTFLIQRIIIPIDFTPFTSFCLYLIARRSLLRVMTSASSSLTAASVLWLRIVSSSSLPLVWSSSSVAKSCTCLERLRYVDLNSGSSCDKVLDRRTKKKFYDSLIKRLVNGRSLYMPSCFSVFNSYVFNLLFWSTHTSKQGCMIPKIQHTATCRIELALKECAEHKKIPFLNSALLKTLI